MYYTLYPWTSYQKMALCTCRLRVQLPCSEACRKLLIVAPLKEHTIFIIVTSLQWTETNLRHLVHSYTVCTLCCAIGLEKVHVGITQYKPDPYNCKIYHPRKYLAVYGQWYCNLRTPNNELRLHCPETFAFNLNITSLKQHNYGRPCLLLY